MADIGASNWSETDASNNSAAPDGAPEGMAPGGVNNTIRAMMGAIKRLFTRQSAKTTAGTSTAYTLTYGVAPGAYIDGETYLVRFNATCGASPTLNVNSLGATPLYYYAGASGAWVAVTAGLITADQVLRCVYNTSAGAFLVQGLEHPTRYYVSRSFSAASEVDFTGIPAYVNHLEILVEGAIGTDGAAILMRTYGADGNIDTGGSDYSTFGNFTNGTTNSPYASGSSSIALTGAHDSGSDVGFQVLAKAANIQAARWTKFLFNACWVDTAGASGNVQFATGQRGEADRITGIRLFPSSGTFSGRATIIGTV